MPSVRTFIAIEMGPQVLDALGQAQNELRHGEGGRAGRWVKRENLHLTLKFLGEVPVGQLESVYQAVARAGKDICSFVLAVTDLGCLPNLRRPRVICVDVQDRSGRLLRLQEAVERELTRLGFPAERRGFRPHLTLGRVRRQATRGEVEALAKSIAAHRSIDGSQVQVDEVAVVKSELTPNGPIYTRLFGAPLAGAEDE